MPMKPFKRRIYRSLAEVRADFSYISQRRTLVRHAMRELISPAFRERLMMVVDGSAGCYVWPEDRVQIRRSAHPARFVRLADHEFFQVLRNKLGWGLPHVAKPGHASGPGMPAP